MSKYRRSKLENFIQASLEADVLNYFQYFKYFEYFGMSTSIFVSFFLLVFFKEKAWPCAMDIPIIVGIRPLESTNSFVFVLLYYMKLLLSFTFRHFRLNSASVARAKALHPWFEGQFQLQPKSIKIELWGPDEAHDILQIWAGIWA